MIKIHYKYIKITKTISTLYVASVWRLPELKQHKQPTHTYNKYLITTSETNIERILNEIGYSEYHRMYVYI